MKDRILVAFLVVMGLASAAIPGSFDKRSIIGPAIATLSNWGVAEQKATVGAGAGAGRRNCLSKLDIGNRDPYAPFTLRILDGGTTVYAVSYATGSVVNLNWGDGEMCGTANTAMYIGISSYSATAFNTTWTLSYLGYTY